MIKLKIKRFLYRLFTTRAYRQRKFERAMLDAYVPSLTRALYQESILLSSIGCKPIAPELMKRFN